MHNASFIAVSLILAASILWLIVAAIRLCAADARRRGKSPVLVVLAVFFFFPLGLIVWLLFRPEPIDKGSPRPFRLEDYRVQ